MGRTHWKYPLIEGAKDEKPKELGDKLLWIPLWMPSDYRHITIDTQANTACLWAEVDPESPARWYRIAAVSTGQPVPDGALTWLGRCALTIEGRTLPTPTENSVKHFYLVDESAKAAAAALDLPVKGPDAGQVIRVGLWFGKPSLVA